LFVLQDVLAIWSALSIPFSCVSFEAVLGDQTLVPDQVKAEEVYPSQPPVLVGV
jgi:hypothetical protein